MDDFTYEPAPDIDRSLAERLRDFPREPHLWMYGVRSAVALALRGWLRIYHRFEVSGREHLPLGRSFILVANHQSHLDALSLLSTIPLRFLHRAFPAAAADYFFSSMPRTAFSSVVINALPFDRKAGGAESLAVCRHLLNTEGNVLILFPEGTRSDNDAPGRFRSGIGQLAAGVDVPVVPCFIDGAAHAFPRGAALPRPGRLRVRIGAARNYGNRGTDRAAVAAVCKDLQEAVAELGPSDGERTGG